MKNAVIYARYSSDKQNEMSIEGQIDECRRYAEENDMIVESIYEGVGYHKLVEGAEFFIMEGPHVVGEGIVTDSCKEKEWKG